MGDVLCVGFTAVYFNANGLQPTVGDIAHSVPVDSLK